MGGFRGWRPGKKNLNTGGDWSVLADEEQQIRRSPLTCDRMRRQSSQA